MPELVNPIQEVLDEANLKAEDISKVHQVWFQLKDCPSDPLLIPSLPLLPLILPLLAWIHTTYRLEVRVPYCNFSDLAGFSKAITRTTCNSLHHKQTTAVGHVENI